MSIKKTRLVLLLASLILCLASFLPAVAVQAEDTFKVNAKAAFAVDAQSGKILYDQDGEKPWGSLQSQKSSVFTSSLIK